MTLLAWHEVTLDHIVPLSKGGRSTYENLRVACLLCNCARGSDDTMTIMDILEARARLVLVRGRRRQKTSEPRKHNNPTPLRVPLAYITNENAKKYLEKHKKKAQ